MLTRSQSKVETPSNKKTGFYRWSDSGISSYLMLAPFVLLFLIFSVYPVLASLRLSFMRYNAICNPDKSPCGSVGFGNYTTLILDDARFHKALINTTLYVIGAVLIGMIASLSLALSLQSHKRQVEFKKSALLNLDLQKMSQFFLITLNAL